MANIVKWIVSSVLLSSLMLGTALILFLTATVFAEALNKMYRVDDDWSILALPIGAVVGLTLGVRYRNHRWLRVLAGVLLVLLVGLIVSWSIPRRAPEGMQGLSVGLGNMIGAALLHTALITGGLSLAVAAIATSIVALISKHGRRKRDNENATSPICSKIDQP
jgi:hypothetical protein